MTNRKEYMRVWRLSRREHINAGQRLRYTQPGQRDMHLSGMKRRYAARAALIVAAKARPCTDCKGIFNPWQMDFDHLDAATKSNNVGTLASCGTVADIIAEIKKCEVVCSNCHRNRTHQRNLCLTKKV